MQKIVEKNGNGTTTVKSWLWIILWVVTVLGIFGTSVGGYSVLKYKVSENTRELQTHDEKIGGIGKDIEVLKNDVKWLCRKFGKKE